MLCLVNITNIFKITQDHYDFGMRALKSVLVMAGALKRQNPDKDEEVVLIRALRDSNLPKFLKDDAVLFQAILSDLFPGVEIPDHDYGRFQEEIESVTDKRGLQVVSLQVSSNAHLLLSSIPTAITCTLDSSTHMSVFIQVKKVIQLYETMEVRHGVMLVGPTGSGKTTVYQVINTFSKMYLFVLV